MDFFKLEKLEGKTIQQIDRSSSKFEVYFTDGSKLELNFNLECEGNLKFYEVLDGD
jgi:hypothetical protein